MQLSFFNAIIGIGETKLACAISRKTMLDGKTYICCIMGVLQWPKMNLLCISTNIKVNQVRYMIHHGVIGIQTNACETRGDGGTNAT